MSLVPAIAGALGSYYGPRAFNGALDIADNYVRKGSDALCALNPNLCTTGALTRREKKQLARIQNGAMVQAIPRGMPMSSGAVVPYSGGGLQAHVASTRKLTGRPARFRSSRGKTIVSHTEFVSVATAQANAFHVQPLNECNPTNASMFPWLASIAGNFDKYRFVQLGFEYVPVVPTTFAGRVGLIFDYDSQDAPPTTRADCYSFSSSTEGPVWDRLKLIIKTDNVVRYTDSASTVDKKLVDLGALFVFTDSASAGDVGDVLVHYTVELIEPQPNPTLSTERWISNSGNGVVGINTPVIPQGNNFVSSVSGNFTSVTLTFAVPGDYTVLISSNGGTVGGTVTITGASATIGTNTEAVSTTTALAWCNVRIPTPGVVLNFSGFTSSTPGDQFLVVTRIGRNDFF